MNNKKLKVILGLMSMMILCGGLLFSSDKPSLTIIHTNDMHSHFLGYPSNNEYTPLSTNDDETIGGWARMATIISEIRKSRSNPVLVCDAGDFLMGSLFHLLSREKAYELRLMNAMGYDITTLGNHEFDLKPEGLARTIRSASDAGKIPDIVLSNLIFDPENSEDDALEELLRIGMIQPYRVLEKNGIKIGVFGLIGINAAEVAPFASPVTFADPIETALKVVDDLQKKEAVDIIICLSHSGLSDDKKKSEDEILAEKVSGIDIIISGHTHTLLQEPILVNNTLIVQAGAYVTNMGILDVSVQNAEVQVEFYESMRVDDQIPGDPEITRLIESFKSEIESNVLSDLGFDFDTPIAQTDFDLVIEEKESPLGNLVADSIRWAINKADFDPEDPSTRVAFGVMSNGLIRDPIMAGKTGEIPLSDLFRAVPLGIGLDDSMGYPLISVYLYASEIKKALEVLTSIYPIKGSDFYLQISGVKFTFNPHRMIFDRVTDIWIEDTDREFVPLDYSRSNKTLYRVGADYYNASFLKFVGDFTMQILKIVPKDRLGQPIDDLETALVDADKIKPGVQELKEWRGFIDYILSFPDKDGDGLSEILEKYKEKQGRIVKKASWNPYKLLRRGTFVTWVVVGIFILFHLGMIFLIRFIFRKIKRKRRQA